MELVDGGGAVSRERSDHGYADEKNHRQAAWHDMACPRLMTAAAGHRGGNEVGHL